MKPQNRTSVSGKDLENKTCMATRFTPMPTFGLDFRAPSLIVRFRNIMLKPKFQIGSGPFVRISLPSKAHGDSDTFRGKAVVSCYSLQCSAEVAFTRSELERFVKHLEQVYKTLKGEFHLESTDTRFRFVGTADNKGRVRINVSVSGFQFSQPENNEWTATATFTCFPSELEDAITELTKSESGPRE